MTTRTEITNLALAHLDHAGRVEEFNENSAEAIAARDIFDFAYESMLQEHDWNFARMRVEGAVFRTNYFEWAFAYSYPNNCFFVRHVRREKSNLDYDYRVETHSEGSRIICTHLDNAIIHYTGKPALAVIPQYAKMQLSWSLAYHMASRINADKARAEAGYVRNMGIAQSLDANEHYTQQVIEPATHILARITPIDEYCS